MLTPAEELGLAGMSLASRVRKAFFKIPEPDLLTLMDRIRDESARRHVVYLRDGQTEVIRVWPCPITVLPDQLAYIHYVTLTILNALKRLPDLYMQDFAVREVLKLPADEEKWLWDSWGPSQRENNPVFCRLDAMVDLVSPMWKDSLRYVEPNLTGIGGLHLIPTSERIVAELVPPVLEEHDPELQLELGRDVRELLIQDLLDHLQAINRSGQNICLVEPKYAGSGPDDQAELARYFHSRHGLKIFHADPAELSVQGDDVVYNGEIVDVVYRDYGVPELLDLERKGTNVEAMRLLFKQNRVVSSIAADLDQKSCWEILTDAQFTQKYFSAEDRQVFRRHILWTRIVSERRVQLPDGHTGELIPFIRRERESLVLKPNRAYGGEGVLLGHLVDPATWESALERALKDPQRWVVQRLASIPVTEFPVVGPDGKVHFEPFYTVMGFAATKYGVALMVRASQKQVVNVAQRGGMCVTMIGRPPAQLHGPG